MNITSVICALPLLLMFVGCSANNPSTGDEIGPVATSPDIDVLPNDQSSSDGVEQMDVDTVPVDSQYTSILERRWDLILYTALGGSESELLPYTVRQFETSGNELDGVVDCNGSGGGTYKLNENSIIFTFGPATEIDCGLEGDQYREQERSLDDLFSRQRELMINLENDTLTLTAADGRKLVFREIDVGDSTNIDVVEVRSGDLASLGNSIFSQPRYQFFRNQNELNEFNSSLVQSPSTIEGLPQINFDESTILFVANEIVGSGGYSIEITSAEIISKNLLVEVQKTAPGENCSVDSAPTGPYIFYSVDGVYENIDFVERPVLSPPCT